MQRQRLYGNNLNKMAIHSYCTFWTHVLKLYSLNFDLTAARLTCVSAAPSSTSFLSVVANSSLVGGDVTTTLFLRVVGGGRRLGRCVVGTGRAVNEGGAEIILLLGAFISVPLAPLGVANRRASGGVHTHASIVHSSTVASTLDV